ncbi:hypothetical protein JCM3774_005816 [Rhodotorula dairenensis]
MSGQANDKQRSSFVLKLHQLLSANLHPEYLHWINNDTFAVTSVDSQARTALAPQWEFNSLSSFIRQLSYYSFKRLSDRRRSVERRPSVPSFIVFTYPSGNFVRDDESRTLLIPRKLRSRKPKSKRKASATSSAGGSRELSPSTSPPPAKTKQAAKRPSAGRRKDSNVDLKDALHSYQLPAWSSLEPRPHSADDASPQFSNVSLPPPPAAHFPLELPPPQPLQKAQQPPASVDAPYPTPTRLETGGSYFQDHDPAPTPLYSSPAWYYTPAPYALQPPEPRATATGKVDDHLTYMPSGLVAPPSPPVEPDTLPTAQVSQAHPARFSAPRVGDALPYSPSHYAHPQSYAAHGSPGSFYMHLPPMQPANPVWYGPA